MAARSPAATNTATIGPMLVPTPSMNVTGALSRGRQPRYRETTDDLGDLAGQPPLDGGIVARVDRLDDDPPDGAHLVLAEATGRGRRRAQADAGRRVGRQRIERDAVLVDRDPDLVE